MLPVELNVLVTTSELTELHLTSNHWKIILMFNFDKFIDLCSIVDQFTPQQWEEIAITSPYYDNMLQNPQYYRDQKGITFTVYKHFAPQKYIDKVAKQRNMSPDQLLDNRDQKRIDLYAQQMQDGQQFAMPVLDYSNGFRQEGLHRAFAARQLGLKSMPFVVVDTY